MSLPNEATGKRNIFLEIVCVIILAASAMGENTLDYSGRRVMKSISLAVVVIGAGILLVTGNFDRVKKAGRFAGIYSFVLIGIIVWSIFLWIINLETVDFIMRGTMKFMYQFVVILFIFAVTYLFGERAIYVTFYGIAAANAGLMVMNMASYGIEESIMSIVEMVQTTDSQHGFARSMELHDVTFTYGFFIIYFLFFAYHNKERLICMFIAFFFFFLGWKRIAFIALGVAIITAIFMGRLRPKGRSRFMTFVAWSFVIVSFAYVVMVRNGMFEIVTNMLGINAMGRNEIYNYIAKYYDINIGFLGYGFEYTTVFLERLMASKTETYLGVLALHNNVLTVYIELGFVGFWAWILYTWIFQLRWMKSHWGEKVTLLFFLCELYIFITYMTDNTLYYYYTSLTLRLLPMAYSFHVPYEKEIRLWPWVKEQKPRLIPV